MTDQTKADVTAETTTFKNPSMLSEQQLQAIVEAANKLIGVKDSSLILLDEKKHLLYFHFVTGEKSQALRQLTMQPGEGIAGWVIQHGIPLVVPDVALDPRYNSKISETLNFRTQSIMCVPIFANSKTVGAFEVVNRLDGQAFTEKDLPLLAAFAALIAVVLENSTHTKTIEQLNIRLEDLVVAKSNEVDVINKNLASKTQRLALTTKMISLINSNQSMIQIFRGVAEQLQRLIPFDYVTLALLEDDKKEITLLEILPVPQPSFLEGVKISFDDPVIKYVVYYKRSLFHNRSRWYHCFLDNGRFLETQLNTMLCIPMVASSDAVLGTLNIGSAEKHRYPKEAVDIVTFIVKQLGVALERHRLRNELETVNQKLGDKTIELRKNIIRIGDANMRLFNMQQQLREQEKEMKRLLDEVQDKNEELNTTLAELKQTQTQLVQSEKMASLGQLVAGIAHELNTPAGAIKAASEIIPDYLQKTLASLQELIETEQDSAPRHLLFELVDIMMLSVKEQERKSTSEIREQTKSLTQILKQRGVKNNRSIAKDLARCYLENRIDDIIELFEYYEPTLTMSFLNNCSRVLISSRDNRLSIEMISKIVHALKSYSYLDQSQRRSVDLNEDIENTLTILHSQIPSTVKIIRKFSELPKITCMGSELNQVWTNIIQNALQALEGQEDGTIMIETTVNAQYVNVKISDDGPGIPQEIRTKIFDPFFTTKRGKTSGLGLSITQQVINKHNGAIEVESTPGKTTFHVMLPKEGLPAKDPL